MQQAMQAESLGRDISDKFKIKTRVLGSMDLSSIIIFLHLVITVKICRLVNIKPACLQFIFHPSTIPNLMVGTVMTHIFRFIWMMCKALTYRLGEAIRQYLIQLFPFPSKTISHLWWRHPCPCNGCLTTDIPSSGNSSHRWKHCWVWFCGQS